MKVILYMAQSINGFIAKLDNATPWSSEEWKIYKETVGKVGNIIMGRKTYDIMKDDGFDSLGNPFVIVVSQQNLQSEKNTIFVKTPEEALDVAKEKGFPEVLIIGGSQINGLFLKKNLVDEVYLDMEPVLFGQGIPLFSAQENDFQLELLETKPYSKNGLQLRYQVKK